MAKSLKKKFCATAIGSVPHCDAKQICEKILTDYKEIPFWPQMPKRSFFENMYVQYMEGFPCAVIDGDNNKVWVDTSKDLMAGIEKTYQKILDEDQEYFAITEKYAAGFHEFLAQAKKADLGGTRYLKGQVTGPISFGLSVTDEKKQSILYNSELAEVLTKVLAIKARYQIRKLKEIFSDIIIFIDEPYLVSIGSSVVNIKKEDVTTKIDEVITAIHGEGALAGIHCCGNTDWSILLGLDLDILNFDAYNYMNSLSLYPEALKGFLGRGKYLAWGIVPTSDDISGETEDSLTGRISEGMSLLNGKGIEGSVILDSLLVSPSCGCGTLGVEDAVKALELNVRVSRRLKERYGE
jgi:methionine synthase II (cobalamin-independent)